MTNSTPGRSAATGTSDLLRLAPWTEQIQPSPTFALDARAEELRAKGVTLAKLGLGEPDFPTPEHVKAAAIAAIEEDFTRYTNTSGIVPLRQAIADRLRADVGVSYEVAEIVVSVGGKHALFNAIMTLCRPGDEVLLPVPYWVTYPEQVKLAGAVVVPVPSSAATGYKVTPEALAGCLSPRSRLLIVNSPNNPSGAVYSRAEQAALAAFCREHDLWVITDEVYAAFNYTAEGHASIAAQPAMHERTVLVHAVSKAYGMTGWRLGYSAAPRPVAQAIGTLQGHVTSNPTSIAQKAAIAALSGPQEGLDAVRAEYRQRRDRLVAGVRRLKGLRCEPPDGAFYLWVDASDWCGRTLAGREIADADDLATVLLEEAGVVVVPGTGFGDPTHLRLSFAAPPSELDTALERMERLLGRAAGD